MVTEYNGRISQIVIFYSRIFCRIFIYMSIILLKKSTVTGVLPGDSLSGEKSPMERGG